MTVTTRVVNNQETCSLGGACRARSARAGGPRRRPPRQPPGEARRQGRGPHPGPAGQAQRAQRRGGAGDRAVLQHAARGHRQRGHRRRGRSLLRRPRPLRDGRARHLVRRTPLADVAPGLRADRVRTGPRGLRPQGRRGRRRSRAGGRHPPEGGRALDLLRPARGHARDLRRWWGLGAGAPADRRRADGGPDAHRSPLRRGGRRCGRPLAVRRRRRHRPRVRDRPRQPRRGQRRRRPTSRSSRRCRASPRRLHARATSWRR